MKEPQSQQGNMVWLRRNLITILFTGLLGLAGTVGAFYVQDLGEVKARVKTDHEERIRTLEMDFGVMRGDVTAIRQLLTERESNLTNQINQISEHLIQRMDQQYEFIKERLPK